MRENITIIGGGHMGQAIAMGLLNKNILRPSQLTISSLSTKRLNGLKRKGVTVTTDNGTALMKAGVIILAIKPQILKMVLTELKGSILPDQLVLSVAAGTAIKSIKNILGTAQPVVRIMPNLAAEVGESMSVWTKSKEVREKQEAIVIKILEAIGQQTYVQSENLIDIATAISGSGPGYFFYITELLINAGVKSGLSKKVAAILAAQTIYGTALLLKHTKNSPEQLRNAVASKGGTTEAALKEFKKANLDKVFQKAVRAALMRSKVLRRTFN